MRKSRPTLSLLFFPNPNKSIYSWVSHADNAFKSLSLPLYLCWLYKTIMQSPEQASYLQCKNVISKLQRRIDKEGPQIVPLLTDLWKRIENSGYVSGTGNSLLDLRKIDQRVDRFEYSGVMELVSDVQSMLNSAMRYFGLSHEVRSEAKKVHDLFFDILKIAFPDRDFREARNAVSFSGQIAASTSAVTARPSVASQGKRHKLINEVEPDLSAPQKLLSRGPVPIGEDAKVRAHMPQKESRLVGSSSGRELGQKDDHRPFTHPGELVICKKKRKDREKSVLKPGNGPAGPVSPSSISRSLRSPGPGTVPKDSRLGQQTTQQQGWANQSPHQVNSSGGGGGNVGWANPVKRLRTDAGKRRPSHL